ncbi:UNVERIFIED_CONTAM: hypothetical protein FKN15_031670 [Acipenser sinensis]
MQWQSSVWSQAADCIHKAYTHKLTHECVFKFAIPVTITAPPVLSVCPVLDCWYVKEKPGSFPSAMTQEKSLLYIRTSADQTGPEQNHPADIDPKRVYHVSAGSLCSSSLLTVEGAVEKPQCEINPFTPQPAHVDWSLSLTSGGGSPARPGADWLSTSITAHKGDIGVSSILRVSTATGQATAVLSVFSHTPVLRSRLGVLASLDCGFSVLPGWQDPGSGFAVEWRYQFRGEGRLVYAYNGQTDRLEERSAQQEEASMDLEALHQTGNASLLLHNVDVHHGGTFICTVYLPYILAQVAMELEVIGKYLTCTTRLHTCISTVCLPAMYTGTDSNGAGGHG